MTGHYTIGTIGTKTKNKLPYQIVRQADRDLTADSCFKPFNSNSNGCSILESRDVILMILMSIIGSD